MSEQRQDTRVLPFPLPDAELLLLGKDEVAYVKSYVMDGKQAFVLHGADGTALAVQNSDDAARDAALYQDLDLVALH